MEAGHEGNPTAPPAEAEQADVLLGSLTPEEQGIVVQKAAALAVSALEPVLLKLGEGLRSLAGDVAAIQSVGGAAAPDESRLDSLEARINAFGLGGETVGDALALAGFALATARAIAGAVERSQGMKIPLPPAPDRLAPEGEATVIGAELAASVSL